MRAELVRPSISQGSKSKRNVTGVTWPIGPEAQLLVPRPSPSRFSKERIRQEIAAAAQDPGLELANTGGAVCAPQGTDSADTPVVHHRSPAPLAEQNTDEAYGSPSAVDMLPSKSHCGLSDPQQGIETIMVIRELSDTVGKKQVGCYASVFCPTFCGPRFNILTRRIECHLS